MNSLHHHTFSPWRDKNGTRVVAAESYWRQPLKWDREAKAAGERRRVFCASLADVFEDWSGPMVDSQGRELARHVGPTSTNIAPWDSEWVQGAGNDFRSLTMQDVRADLFRLIDDTPNLDWLILTKRPENIGRMMPPRFQWVETGRKIWQLESPVGSRRFHGIVWGDTDQPKFGVPGGFSVVSTYGPPEEHGEGERATVEACKAEVERLFPAARPNVWLGVSVENQKAADERIPALLATPAAVRFLSCEPLITAVDLGAVTHTVQPGYFGDSFRALHRPGTPEQIAKLPPYPGIHWVIVGGESGSGARPCNVEWIRGIIRQCREADVACFVKQLGSIPRDANPMSAGFKSFAGWDGETYAVMLRDRKGGDPAEWAEDLRVRQMPESR